MLDIRERAAVKEDAVPWQCQLAAGIWDGLRNHDWPWHLLPCCDDHETWH